MMFDRRLLLSFDWFFLALTVGLGLIGVLNLYSASHVSGAPGLNPAYLRQIYWFLIGLGIIAVVLNLDYRLVDRFAYGIYGMAVLLLVATLAVGKTTSGAQRWLVLFGLSLQASEFAKIAMIVALAHFFHHKREPLKYDLKDLVVPFFLCALLAVLVLKQPDLGTTIVLVLILFSILFLVEVKLKAWLVMVATTVVASPFSWFFLKGYQKARLIAFLNPQADPLGVGYQGLQSKIAVGSGKLIGKGFLEGTQTKLRFLPEQQTDFIFSVLAEEWGFIGSLVIILLFFLWISWAVGIAARARDTFSTLVCYGVACAVAWQVFMNISMAVGLLPVVGVPLPFLSYGGSSLISFMAGTGLILSIKMRRFVN